MSRLATTLKALAFLWATAATVFLLVAAGREGPDTSTGLVGETVVGHVDVALASSMGPWLVGLLVVVTLVSGIPLGVALTHPEAHRSVTWTVGLLLLAFSIMSGINMGLMYLPAAVVLLASATVTAVRAGERNGLRSAAPRMRPR